MPFQTFFWYKFLVIVTEKSDECVWQDTCECVALREFIQSYIIDSLQMMCSVGTEPCKFSWKDFSSWTWTKFRFLRHCGVSRSLKNPMIHRLKERWKLFVLMYGLENFFWKRFENVCMKDCSVLRMNSLSKLGVRYGLLDHCTWQLDRCIMLSRLMNHSKSRDHVQVRWSFRNFQSWPVIMHWNLKTDSELKLELLVSLVWSLSFQDDKLCFWRRSSRARC